MVGTVVGRADRKITWGLCRLLPPNWTTLGTQMRTSRNTWTLSISLIITRGQVSWPMTSGSKTRWGRLVPSRDRAHSKRITPIYSVIRTVIFQRHVFWSRRNRNPWGHRLVKHELLLSSIQTIIQWLASVRQLTIRIRIWSKTKQYHHFLRKPMKKTISRNKHKPYSSRIKSMVFIIPASWRSQKMICQDQRLQDIKLVRIKSSRNTPTEPEYRTITWIRLSIQV
jgi:hypothetical protein